MIERIIDEFINSEMLSSYEKELKKVSENPEASAILDEYRSSSVKFMKLRESGENISDEQMERYKYIVDQLNKNEILRNFIKYDTEIYLFIENLNSQLREVIVEKFESNYK